jgi:hypothetical protein
LCDINDRVKRRRFLKVGIFGGLVLGAAGLGLWPSRKEHAPKRALKVLDERRFAIFAAVAARTVRAKDADPVEIAHRMDDYLSLQTEQVQGDIKSLLLLFENALAGLLFDARVKPFTRLSPEGQDQVLNAWRDSKISVRRVGYHALRKLTLSAHWSMPEHWKDVGYPGPPTIQVPA